MNKGLLGGLAAIALVAAAGASAPVAAQNSNLTGPYVGGHIGGAFDNSDLIVWSKTDAWDISDNDDGVFGGFQIGLDTPADTRFGSLVLGVVGDFSFIDLDADQEKFGDRSAGEDQHICCGSPSGGPPGLFETSIDGLATVRVRIGVPAGDQMLLYAHGGLAMADFEVEAVLDEGGPWAKDPIKSEGWTLGWVGGVGVEHTLPVLNNTLSLFAEYSFMGFGDDTINSTDGGEFNGRVVREDRNLHLIKVGVNLRFESHLSGMASFLPGNTRKTASKTASIR